MQGTPHLCAYLPYRYSRTYVSACKTCYARIRRMHMRVCAHSYTADGARAGITFALALALARTHTYADTDRCCLCERAVFASVSPASTMQGSQEVPQLSLQQWQQLMKRPPTDCSKLLVINKAGDFDLHTLWSTPSGFRAASVTCSSSPTPRSYLQALVAN